MIRFCHVCYIDKYWRKCRGFYSVMVLVGYNKSWQRQKTCSVPYFVQTDSTCICRKNITSYLHYPHPTCLQMAPCNTELCQSFTPFTTGACSETCGPATVTSTRQCLVPVTSSVPASCLVKQETCNRPICEGKYCDQPAKGRCWLSGIITSTSLC